MGVDGPLSSCKIPSLEGSLLPRLLKAGSGPVPPLGRRCTDPVAVGVLDIATLEGNLEELSIRIDGLDPGSTQVGYLDQLIAFKEQLKVLYEPHKKAIDEAIAGDEGAIKQKANHIKERYVECLGVKIFVKIIDEHTQKINTARGGFETDRGRKPAVKSSASRDVESQPRSKETPLDWQKRLCGFGGDEGLIGRTVSKMSDAINDLDSLLQEVQRSEVSTSVTATEGCFSPICASIQNIIDDSLVVVERICQYKDALKDSDLAGVQIFEQDFCSERETSKTVGEMTITTGKNQFGITGNHKKNLFKLKMEPLGDTTTRTYVQEGCGDDGKTAQMGGMGGMPWLDMSGADDTDRGLSPQDKYVRHLKEFKEVAEYFFLGDKKSNPFHKRLAKALAEVARKLTDTDSNRQVDYQFLAMASVALLGYIMVRCWSTGVILAGFFTGAGGENSFTEPLAGGEGTFGIMDVTAAMSLHIGEFRVRLPSSLLFQHILWTTYSEDGDSPATKAEEALACGRHGPSVVTMRYHYTEAYVKSNEVLDLVSSMNCYNFVGSCKHQSGDRAGGEPRLESYDYIDSRVWEDAQGCRTTIEAAWEKYEARLRNLKRGGVTELCENPYNKKVHQRNYTRYEFIAKDRVKSDQTSYFIRAKETYSPLESLVVDLDKLTQVRRDIDSGELTRLLTELCGEDSICKELRAVAEIFRNQAEAFFQKAKANHSQGTDHAVVDQARGVLCQTQAEKIESEIADLHAEATDILEKAGGGDVDVSDAIKVLDKVRERFDWYHNATTFRKDVDHPRNLDILDAKEMKEAETAVKGDVCMVVAEQALKAKAGGVWRGGATFDCLDDAVKALVFAGDVEGLLGLTLQGDQTRELSAFLAPPGAVLTADQCNAIATALSEDPSKEGMVHLFASFASVIQATANTILAIGEAFAHTELRYQNPGTPMTGQTDKASFFLTKARNRNYSSNIHPEETVAQLKFNPRLGAFARTTNKEHQQLIEQLIKFYTEAHKEANTAAPMQGRRKKSQLKTVIVELLSFLTEEGDIKAPQGWLAYKADVLIPLFNNLAPDPTDADDGFVDDFIPMLKQLYSPKKTTESAYEAVREEVDAIYQEKVSVLLESKNSFHKSVLDAAHVSLLRRLKEKGYDKKEEQMGIEAIDKFKKELQRIAGVHKETYGKDLTFEAAIRCMVLNITKTYSFFTGSKPGGQNHRFSHFQGVWFRAINPNDPAGRSLEMPIEQFQGLLKEYGSGVDLESSRWDDMSDNDWATCFPELAALFPTKPEKIDRPKIIYVASVDKDYAGSLGGLEEDSFRSVGFKKVILEALRRQRDSNAVGITVTQTQQCYLTERNPTDSHTGDAEKTGKTAQADQVIWYGTKQPIGDDRRLDIEMKALMKSARRIDMAKGVIGGLLQETRDKIGLDRLTVNGIQQGERMAGNYDQITPENKDGYCVIMRRFLQMVFMYESFDAERNQTLYDMVVDALIKKSGDKITKEDVENFRCYGMPFPGKPTGIDAQKAVEAPFREAEMRKNVYNLMEAVFTWLEGRKIHTGMGTGKGKLKTMFNCGTNRLEQLSAELQAIRTWKIQGPSGVESQKKGQKTIAVVTEKKGVLTYNLWHGEKYFQQDTDYKIPKENEGHIKQLLAKVELDTGVPFFNEFDGDRLELVPTKKKEGVIFRVRRDRGVDGHRVYLKDGRLEIALPAKGKDLTPQAVIWQAYARSNMLLDFDFDYGLGLDRYIYDNRKVIDRKSDPVDPKASTTDKIYRSIVGDIKRRIQDPRKQIRLLEKLEEIWTTDNDLTTVVKRYTPQGAVFTHYLPGESAERIVTEVDPATVDKDTYEYRIGMARLQKGELQSMFDTLNAGQTLKLYQGKTDVLLTETYIKGIFDRATEGSDDPKTIVITTSDNDPITLERNTISGKISLKGVGGDWKVALMAMMASTKTKTLEFKDSSGTMLTTVDIRNPETKRLSYTVTNRAGKLMYVDHTQDTPSSKMRPLAKDELVFQAMREHFGQKDVKFEYEETAVVVEDKLDASLESHLKRLFKVSSQGAQKSLEIKQGDDLITLTTNGYGQVNFQIKPGKKRESFENPIKKSLHQFNNDGEYMGVCAEAGSIAEQKPMAEGNASSKSLRDQDVGQYAMFNLSERDVGNVLVRLLSSSKAQITESRVRSQLTTVLGRISNLMASGHVVLETVPEKAGDQPEKVVYEVKPEGYAVTIRGKTYEFQGVEEGRAAAINCLDVFFSEHGYDVKVKAELLSINLKSTRINRSGVSEMLDCKRLMMPEHEITEDAMSSFEQQRTGFQADFLAEWTANGIGPEDVTTLGGQMWRWANGGFDSFSHTNVSNYRAYTSWMSFPFAQHKDSAYSWYQHAASDQHFDMVPAFYWTAVLANEFSNSHTEISASPIAFNFLFPLISMFFVGSTLMTYVRDMNKSGYTFNEVLEKDMLFRLLAPYLIDALRSHQVREAQGFKVTEIGGQRVPISFDIQQALENRMLLNAFSTLMTALWMGGVFATGGFPIDGWECMTDPAKIEAVLGLFGIGSIGLWTGFNLWMQEEGINRIIGWDNYISDANKMTRLNSLDYKVGRLVGENWGLMDIPSWLDRYNWVAEPTPKKAQKKSARNGEKKYGLTGERLRNMEEAVDIILQSEQERRSIYGKEYDAATKLNRGTSVKDKWNTYKNAIGDWLAMYLTQETETSTNFASNARRMATMLVRLCRSKGNKAMAEAIYLAAAGKSIPKALIKKAKTEAKDAILKEKDFEAVIKVLRKTTMTEAEYTQVRDDEIEAVFGDKETFLMLNAQGGEAINVGLEVVATATVDQAEAQYLNLRCKQVKAKLEMYKAEIEAYCITQVDYGDPSVIWNGMDVYTVITTLLDGGAGLGLPTSLQSGAVTNNKEKGLIAAQKLMTRMAKDRQKRIERPGDQGVVEQAQALIKEDKALVRKIQKAREILCISNRGDLAAFDGQVINLLRDPKNEDLRIEMVQAVERILHQPQVAGPAVLQAWVAAPPQYISLI